MFAKVSSLSLDLDFGLEEFLEFSDDHDAVFDWVGAINGESLDDLGKNLGKSDVTCKKLLGCYEKDVQGTKYFFFAITYFKKPQ